ncbi:MAG: GGDEF domain-containing protein [Treponema sp.]|nr:GGDEF domain-containing protein [Candidatus Treponema equifaecale]
MIEEVFKNKELKRDTLTGLYDRTVIVEYANYLVKENVPFSIALVDIDNFKNVNDNYGHSIGDKVICAITKKLQEELKGIAAVGRFGGDEFMVIVENIVDYDAIWTVCRTFTRAINGLTIPELPNCFITTTVGLSRFPNDGSSYDELIEKTDKALYRGKMKGRSCFIIYLEEKHKNISLRSSNDTNASPMQRITTLYKVFNQHKDLMEGIKAILQHFSTTMMIDYLAVQSDSKIVHEVIYPLVKNNGFKHINNELIKNIINPTIGEFHLNDHKHFENLTNCELNTIYKEQGIKSSAYAVISYNDKIYGYLRADSITHQRIWQHDDLEILVTAANAIAVALHYQNKELDNLS